MSSATPQLDDTIVSAHDTVMSLPQSGGTNPLAHDTDMSLPQSGGTYPLAHGTDMSPPQENTLVLGPRPTNRADVQDIVQGAVMSALQPKRERKKIYVNGNHVTIPTPCYFYKNRNCLNNGCTKPHYVEKSNDCEMENCRPDCLFRHHDDLPVDSPEQIEVIVCFFINAKANPAPVASTLLSSNLTRPSRAVLENSTASLLTTSLLPSNSQVPFTETEKFKAAVFAQAQKIAYEKDKKKSCFEWERGSCFRGDSCRFSHVTVGTTRHENVSSGGDEPLDTKSRDADPTDRPKKVTSKGKHRHGNHVSSPEDVAENTKSRDDDPAASSEKKSKNSRNHENDNSSDNGSLGNGSKVFQVHHRNKNGSAKKIQAQSLQDDANAQALLDAANAQALLDAANAQALLDTANAQALQDAANVQALLDSANAKALRETANAQALAKDKRDWVLTLLCVIVILYSVIENKRPFSEPLFRLLLRSPEIVGLLCGNVHLVVVIIALYAIIAIRIGRFFPPISLLCVMYIILSSLLVIVAVVYDILGYFFANG
jgi:hypothetical protein